MDVSKILKAANTFYLVCKANDPGGSDGNLFTNWVDDGALEDEDDVKAYSDEELHDRFMQMLEQYSKKKEDKKDLSSITPKSDEIPELTRDMKRTFFGVDLADAKK